MKSCTRGAILLLGCWLCHSAWADIYAFADDEGALSLSNVPADGRYALMIKEPAAAVPPKGLAGKTSFDQVVEEVSRNHGLESALLHAVISVESRYNPKAVSKKGAAGLMQLMPATAKRYGVVDAFDPVQNVTGGARYLRDLLGQFNNNMSLALAAYNAGETAVVRHGNRVPPYRETLNYVSRVLDFYQRYQSGF